ncbi:MAG: hypothetical protein A2Y33_10960 [Spirochaetes bacterium GWF1_51_8]|nr:MAG: hypothetical protein A2Y33_10960 [Spirochaetes bacterium GWF1_51_8]
MKLRLFAGTAIIISFFMLTSCFNLFSLLNPGEPATVDNVPMLISLGDGYLSSGEYTKAYDAFEQAVLLDPDNSLAIEGLCTAYIYNLIPPTNIIRALITTNYALLDLNKLYSASGFVHDKLYTIVSGAGDGIIPYNDININLNFLLFNTAYAAFIIGDSDQDGDILWDTNDYLIFFPDLSMSNNLPNTTNFITAIEMLVTINAIIPQFTTLISRTEYSLDIIANSVTSSTVKAEVSNISASITSMKNSVLSNFDYVSNLTSLSQFGISSIEDLTNLWMMDGFMPTNYTDFTNAMAAAGITDLVDMESQLTQIFPDLTNFNDLISNYFGL